VVEGLPVPLRLLDQDALFWHSDSGCFGIGASIMLKSYLAVVVAAVGLLGSSGAAQSGPYPFGDEPYRLDWLYEPEITNGCWKWNWQQYQWNNFCPTYVQPKAFMYPRSARAVVRTKG
jgi:hypothetical protein